MSDAKICPGCKAEYEAHVKVCPDCQLNLVSEILEEQDVPRVDPEKSVIIAKGPIHTLTELVGLLDNRKIPHTVDPVQKGLDIELTHGTEFGVYVDPDRVDEVGELLKDQVHEEFPELDAADEQLEAGKCPACGAVTGDAKVCPECELPLWVDSGENPDQD